MRLSRDELKNLMKVKMMRAGLTEEHAEQTAEILTWSHERGYASHGAVRVEYYSERIAKGGITNHPKFTWKETCQRQPKNVDFRRKEMSFFGGQHRSVYSPYTPLHLPA